MHTCGKDSLCMCGKARYCKHILTAVRPFCSRTLPSPPCRFLSHQRLPSATLSLLIPRVAEGHVMSSNNTNSYQSACCLTCSQAYAISVRTVPSLTWQRPCAGAARNLISGSKVYSTALDTAQCGKDFVTCLECTNATLRLLLGDALSAPPEPFSASWPTVAAATISTIFLQ